MQAVQEGETVSGAVKQFHVPRKTLDDRVKGRMHHGMNPGPCTALASIPGLQRKEGRLVPTARVFVHMHQIIRISYCITHCKSFKSVYG